MRVRVLLTLVMLVGALVAFAMRVEAGVQFCEADPVIQIGDKQVTVTVQIPSDQVANLRGPVTIIASLPRNHPPTRVTYQPNAPFAEQVVLRESVIPWNDEGPNIVRVSVYVPSAVEHDVIVIAASGATSNQATGHSNKTIEDWLVLR